MGRHYVVAWIEIKAYYPAVRKLVSRHYVVAWIEIAIMNIEINGIESPLCSGVD